MMKLSHEDVSKRFTVKKCRKKYPMCQEWKCFSGVCESYWYYPFMILFSF